MEWWEGIQPYKIYLKLHLIHTNMGKWTLMLYTHKIHKLHLFHIKEHCTNQLAVWSTCESPDLQPYFLPSHFRFKKVLKYYDQKLSARTTQHFFTDSSSKSILLKAIFPLLKVEYGWKEFHCYFEQVEKQHRGASIRVTICKQSTSVFLALHFSKLL